MNYHNHLKRLRKGGGRMGSAEQGTVETQGRWLTVGRTLCFVLNGNDVLLMKRASHKRIFPNRYNGVGGHIERDEDAYSSVRREVKEETGLLVHAIRLMAVYHVDAKTESGVTVFVFVAQADNRSVVESDEGSLHWIPRDSVLQYDLVDELPMVLPRILDTSPEALPIFIHLSYDADDCLQLRFAEMG
jgi:8-oxo-dGTP diphosphatase